MSARIGLLALVGVLGLPAGAGAQVMLYSSRAAFEAAAPGLTIDHFPLTISYQPYPNDYFFHTRPVDSATRDSFFHEGSIVPGLTITCANPVFESQALKLEPVAGGNQIGAATFEDELVMQFSPAVSSVGFDVLGHVYSHPNFNGHVELTVYNGATELLYSEPAVPGSAFVGVTSGAANITRVVLRFVPDEDRDSCTFVSAVEFGTPGSLPACAADFNGDGTVNSTDVSDFINAWFTDQADGTLVTDWDHNGVVNSTDVSAFINSWFDDLAAGCGA